MAEIDLIARKDSRDWIESRVAAGEFGTAEAYLSDLVERDRDARAADEERIAALRKIVEEAERSGVSTRTHREIFEEAMAIAKERDTYRE